MYSLESSELLARITVNPDVMVGKPVIRGMRITVEQILKALGGGVSASGILEDYPELEPQDIQAAILYGLYEGQSPIIFKELTPFLSLTSPDHARKLSP